MKKFKFSDGSIVTASTKDEAIAKHKAIASRKAPTNGVKDDRVHQYSFDFLIENNENINAIERRIGNAIDNIRGVYIVGKGLTDSSWTKEEYGIIASKKFKKGDKVGVSIKILYDSTKKHKTDFGYTIDTSEKGYYDLRDKFGNIVCMDGEVCTVKTVSKLGDIVFTNNDGEEETSFTLSKKEVDTCVG